MSEKIYNAMKNSGALGVTLGIITLVVGITTGVLMIISGAYLLKKKNNVMI